jgi:hypothetical protein
MQELTAEQQRIQNLQFHEMPWECMYGGFDEGDFCEEYLKSEKEFYIVEFHHEFRPEAQRKGEWYFYRGYCKKHWKDAVAIEKHSAAWHDRHKKGKNPQKVKINYIWRVTRMTVND